MNCKYSERTNVRWFPWTPQCLVVHCRNRRLLSEPPDWAITSSRKATVGDVLISGSCGCEGKKQEQGGRVGLAEIITDANYINVRSCNCNKERCPHFEN